MTKIDEAIVMYPSTLMRVEFLEERQRLGDSIILALRRWLKSTDDSLPEIHDGPAWYELEKTWIAGP